MLKITGRRIWIGGYANGLHCYDKKTKQLIDFTDVAGTVSYGSIYYDSTGYLWVGGIRRAPDENGYQELQDLSLQHQTCLQL